MATVSITNDLESYLASLRSYLSQENPQVSNEGSTTRHGDNVSVGDRANNSRDERLGHVQDGKPRGADSTSPRVSLK